MKKSAPARRWRSPVWLLAALIVLVGAWSVATLRLQTELLPLFPASLPSIQLLADLQNSLEDDELQIVPAPGADVSDASLEALAAEIAPLPGVAAAEVTPRPPVRLDRMVAIWLASAPPAQWDALLATLRSPDALRARLAETQASLEGALDASSLALASTDPFRLLEFAPAAAAGPDLPNLPVILRVTSDRPFASYQRAAEFLAAVRAVTDRFAAAQGLPSDRLLITGRPAYAAEISTLMQGDMVKMLAAALAAIALVFWLFYRSLAPLAWIFFVQGLAILASLIVARVVFRELNAVSIGFASILLGVGMDYCILVYHHFADGHTRASSHWPVLRRAIFLSAAVTAATFGVLAFSSFPGLRQFALLIAAGLPFTAFFATTLLARELERRPPSLPAWLPRASDGFAAGLLRHRRWILPVAAVLVAIGWGAVATGHSFFDADLQKLRPPNLAAERGQQALIARYADLAAPTAPPDEARLAENLALWQPGRAPAIHDALTAAGFDPAVWGASTTAVLRVLDEAHAAPPAARRFFGAGPDALWPQLRAELTATAMRESGWLSLGMLAAVILLCALAHRSWRLLTLNLLGLASALGLLLALLTLTGTRMTPISLLCVPLVIGLSIDYAMHVLLAHEETGGDLPRTFGHLAGPVSLTALASVCGFSAPMLSSQPALQNFGVVMDFGTLAAAFTALVLLPVIYRPARRSGAPRFPFFHGRTGYEIGATLGARVPRAVAQFVGGAISALYAHIQPARVKTVRENLALIKNRPISPAEARAMFWEFGRTLGDYYYLARRPAATALGLISEHLGFEHFDAVRRAGRGGLLLTPHLSFFELGGAAAHANGFDIVALTRPESTPGLTAWRADYRARWGVKTLEVASEDQFVFLEIGRELDANRLVAALVDRPNSAKTHRVSFPGGASAFSGAILLLAMSRGCPVIPVTTERLADGTYRVEAHEPFFVERHTRDTTALLESFCQRLADTFLPSLDRHPDQWFHFVPLSRP